VATTTATVTQKKTISSSLTWIGLAVAVVILLIAPQLIKSLYWIQLLNLSMIFGICCLGLNFVLGYAGQMSLGQAAFWGIGAYTSALLTTKYLPMIGIPTSVGPWIGLLAAIAVCAIFGAILGYPTLKLAGHYLAMATLGLGVVIYIVLRENFGFSPSEINLTGGLDGIPDVGRLAIGGFALWPIERYYFVVWAIALAVIVLSLNIVNSRVGRALRAVRDSEVAANAMGVDTHTEKLKVFVLSAMYASLAGSLYAHFQAAVSPKPFDFLGSIELVLMSVIGGVASIWGAALGTAVVLVLKELIRTRMHLIIPGSGGEQEVIAFGILIVVIMIFMPDGLAVGGVRSIQNLFRRPVRNNP